MRNSSKKIKSIVQQISLKYGTRKTTFKLPDQAEIFQVKEPEKKITPSGFADRLRDVHETMNPDLSDIAVVLADKTRLCGYPEYLPVLLDTLKAAGAEPDRVTLYIAYGTHARQTKEECLATYGESYLRHKFIHHDCEDADLFSFFGQTRRGTPVLIRRDIIDAGFLVTFGAISHHYFAGYGGGRKLIFPGLGHKSAIYHNHGLFLDAQLQTLSPFCRSGVLDGNPLAEDLAEIESFRKVDLAIHGILNNKGDVCDLFPGVGPDHFRRVCAEHGKHCETRDDRVFDLVIASSGGYPKDINFIQSHKAIENSAKFVKDGGTLIVLAECPDGVGSKTFMPWFDMGGWERAFERLSENYEGNGGTALSMMAKLQRINILVVTDLEDAVCERIGFEKATMEHAKTLVKQSTGPVAAIPNAGLVVKVTA
ncbi:nickel-dependent lactate racemase [Thermodesulfobacteriota bacterium]